MSPIPSSQPDARHAALRIEAIQFSRYLVGAEPTDDLIERYCAANAVLLAEPVGPADEAILAFARAHPWSIALFDASTGMSAGSVFRRKLLVMMAILETTPALVARTSPVVVGVGELVWRVGAAGAATVAKLVAGLALTRVVTGAARTRSA